MSLKLFLNTLYEEERKPITFEGTTKEEHIKWKSIAKRELLEYLKFEKLNNIMKKSKPKMISSESIDLFKREKYVTETFENVFMPYYVLKPFKTNGKVALAIHGHGSDGKNLIAGVISEKMRDNYVKFNYSYGIELAKMGYTVYIPDLCGSGERQELKRKNKDSDCDEINFVANAIGISIQGIIVSELMYLTEIMESDGFDDLLVCGFSGGGLFSLLISAINEKIKYTISGGYFHSFKSTIFENNFCGCNFIPDFWNRFELCDYVALIAPRKLAVEVGEKDTLNLDSNDVAKYVERIYNIYSGGFIYKRCDGGHKWFGSLYDEIKKFDLEEK